MYFVYILRSVRNPNHRYYGMTTNLSRRLWYHNHGKTRTTAKNMPWEIEMYLAFKQRKIAEEFEKYLKTASGKAFMRKRLLS